MKNKFIFNLSLLIFLNLLVKPFYIIGIDTEILNRVGQQEYGLYFALMNLSFLLNIFMDLGIVNFNTSNISKHQQLVSKHFSTIFSVRLILSILYIGICLVSASILGYGNNTFGLLIPICINQILVGSVLYFRSNLAGLQLYERDSLISILDRLLLIIMCSWVLWGRFADIEMSIELFIYLQTIAYALTALIAFLALRPHLKGIKGKFSMPFNIVILRKSFPYALLILLMGFYYRTDGVMIERMLENGAYEAGIYAQAYRFFEAGNMLAYLFGALLFPMFSGLIGKNEQIAELLNLAFKVITAFALVAAIICFFYSKEIMALRFQSEIEASSNAFKYLMIGFTGICGTYVFGALLTANENLRELNIMALCGVILNVVLNILMIPKFKAEGAAIASMVTQLTMACFQIILVKIKLQIWPGIKTMMRMFLFFLLLLMLAIGLEYTQIQWFYRVLIICLVSIPASLLSKLIDPGSILPYFRLITDSKSHINTINSSD